jgi:spore germination protein GerM
VTPQRAISIAGLTLAGAGLAWLLFSALPSWYGNRARQPVAPVARTPPVEGRRIKARLFYVAESGTRLTSVEQDVPYGEGTAEQAKTIVTAQIASPAPPLVSAIPPGTALRALFVTAEGEAFVDFNAAFMADHPGGSLNELLTVYTIVHALTANLPVVTAVQLLVDGKEIDTLSGHVDLRQPLVKNPAWVEQEP